MSISGSSHRRSVAFVHTLNTLSVNRPTTVCIAKASRTLLCLLPLILLVACGRGVTKSGDQKPGVDPPPKGLASDTIPVRLSDEGLAVFGVERARVELEFGGDRVGRQILEFDNWGLRRRLTTLSVHVPGSVGGPDSSILIFTPQHVVAVDLIKDSGAAVIEPEGGIERFTTLIDPERKQSLGEYIIAEEGFRRTGDTTLFGGYECRIVQREDAAYTITRWLWRGIKLREYFYAGYDGVSFWMNAVSVDLSPDFPDSTFAIPDRQFALKMSYPDK